MTKILEILYRHQDEKYGDFIAKCVPTVPREAFIGIRSPEYKKILKEVHAEAEDELEAFMAALPHRFFEENVLHSALISETKDFDVCLARLEAFLPCIDNWAVSDGLNSKAFAKNREKLIPKIKLWIEDSAPFTQRVGMLFILKYYLEDAFSPEYLEWAAAVRSDEYYVNMMCAWLFAEALAKQWDSAVTFIQDEKLPVWTHNKAIQKARESYRITEEQKEYLKTLRRKTR